MSIETNIENMMEHYHRQIKKKTAKQIIKLKAIRSLKEEQRLHENFLRVMDKAMKFNKQVNNNPIKQLELFTYKRKTRATNDECCHS